MLRFIVVLALLSIVGALLPTLPNPSFDEYKKTFGKTYPSKAEESAREAAFQKTVGAISTDQNLPYQQGLNEYSDWFPDELTKLRGFIPSQPDATGGLPFNPPADGNSPYKRYGNDSYLDWRVSKCVAAIKDQGQCGSCWAFATTSTVESARCLKNIISNPVLLSEQNLVDCSSSYGNGGCAGGNMVNSFKYIVNNKGLNTEDQYPYEAKDNTCRFSRLKLVDGGIRGWVNVQSKNETALMKAVQFGPVAVALDASDPNFMSYKANVYDSKTCNGAKLNHAVVAIGYGVSNGVPYWLCRNSWGTSWGENGYFKIRRGTNMCGIANMASFPQI